MPTPLSFYVHIVESPSPANLLDGCTEGRMLCSFLELAHIPCVYNLAVDRTQFQESMTTRLAQGAQFFNLPPILHFSTHGNEDGIQLTHQREAKEVIPWAELANSIKPINQAIGGGLGICMSTCGGSHGRQMAQVVRKEDIPMGWIVGSTASVSFCDAALAFCTFYRGLQRGADFGTLIPAVRAASGISDFAVDFGHLIHQQYEKRLREVMAKLLQGLGKTQPQASSSPPWLNPPFPFGPFGLPPSPQQ
jgi:hypothetical protein